MVRCHFRLVSIPQSIERPTTADVFTTSINIMQTRCYFNSFYKTEFIVYINKLCCKSPNDYNSFQIFLSKCNKINNRKKVKKRVLYKLFKLKIGKHFKILIFYYQRFCFCSIQELLLKFLAILFYCKGFYICCFKLTTCVSSLIKISIDELIKGTENL